MRAPLELVYGLQSGARGRVSARHTNYGFHTLQAIAAFLVRSVSAAIAGRRAAVPLRQVGLAALSADCCEVLPIVCQRHAQSFQECGSSNFEVCGIESRLTQTVGAYRDCSGDTDWEEDSCWTILFKSGLSRSEI